MRARATGLACGIALLLAACSGGGGSAGEGAAPPCTTDCAGSGGTFLTERDVERVIAQAVGEAQARGVAAHVVVVDRVGNVLGAFSMAGAPATLAISSGLGVTGGLDGIPQGVIPATLSAVAKAVTGAFLSSHGNAFTTRTAGQIVQEHFNPQESLQASGPLYGVQFSQLSCSDVNRNLAHGSVGPKRSPLGLSADPGGLPLYKDGVLVGGIGVEANGLYGFDRDITNIDQDAEELIAVAGGTGFDAPADIRGDRITADGRTFRFVDSQAIRSDPALAPAFTALPGTLVVVPGYSPGDRPEVRAGTVFGTAASGIRADIGEFSPLGAWILVDAANTNRFPPRAGFGERPAGVSSSLTATEVRTLLEEAYKVARRARAQIRRPLGSPAEVTISVVDAEGNLLGLIRTPDGPVFGIDVSVQKARTAMFFSHPAAASLVLAFPPARHLVGTGEVSLAQYLLDARGFLAEPSAFTGATAWSARAIGLLHRPFYPDGIDNGPRGPLSTPIERWSPFNVGFQLDASYNQLIKGVLGDVSTGCVGRQPAGVDTAAPAAFVPHVRNGFQIFPGGVPIYRGTQLMGGIGVSGDGVDQDDMIAFLGLANAARVLGSGIDNAPGPMRADRFAPDDVRLRYVQCPQAPFNGSNEQNACAGL